MEKKKNNRYGLGSIFFDPSRNKFRAEVSTGSKRVQKRFDTRAEAEDWLVSVKSQLNNDEYVSTSPLTVAEWLYEYINIYKRARVKPTTWRSYLLTVGFMEPIGNIRLQSLTAEDVQKFYGRIAQKYAPSTLLKIHKMLKAAYEKALLTNRVKRNPLLAVDPPRLSQKPIEIFTEKEIETLFAFLQNGNRIYGRYYPLIALAFASGARIGELLALEWNSVNFEEGWIFIHQNLLNTIPPTVGETKTLSGIRKISIPNSILSLMHSPDFDFHSRTYVFGTRKNNPMHHSNVERIWHSILTRAGIPSKHFHAIRHTNATMLLARGIPIMEVSRRLGHSKPAHTLNLYGHSIPGYDNAIRDALEDMYSSSFRAVARDSHAPLIPASIRTKKLTEIV